MGDCVVCEGSITKHHVFADEKNVYIALWDRWVAVSCCLSTRLKADISIVSIIKVLAIERINIY
jgi:hypothetical protein